MTAHDLESFSELHTHLSLEGPNLIALSENDSERWAVQKQIRRHRSRVIQHVRRVDTKLNSLEETGFAHLKRLRNIRIKIPVSRQLDFSLTESSSCSRFWILQHEFAGKGFLDCLKRALTAQVIQRRDVRTLRIQVGVVTHAIDEIASAIFWRELNVAGYKRGPFPHNVGHAIPIESGGEPVV